MNPAQLPEDPEVEQLRAQLAAQRQRKSGALVKHKKTTMKAVQCYERPTTYMDPAKIAEVLDADTVDAPAPTDAPAEES